MDCEYGESKWSRLVEAPQKQLEVTICDFKIKLEITNCDLKMNMETLIPTENIEGLILLIRNKKVMIDHDLAQLYGITTKALNQAVKRNSERFPSSFMFTLTANEKKEVVTICDHLKTLKY